jgi:hypothetical protein
MRLAYQVFGSRAFDFRVDVNDWEITGDPIKSGGLVDPDRVEVTERNILLLPLSQAASRRAEITFSLRRPVTHDAPRLEIPLPTPIADSVGTGELIVRAAPEIDVLPDLSSSTGLTAAPAIPTSVVGAVDENGTELHFRTLLPSAVFVADRANRARDVTATAATQIELAQDFAQVEQRFDYLVRYEPIGELVFEAPEAFAQDSELDIQLVSAVSAGDSATEEPGVPLHVHPRDESADALGTGSREFRVMLPQPRLGRFSVKVRYRRPQPRVSSTDVPYTIPLCHPQDGKTTTHRATVRAPKNFVVGLDSSGDESAWRAAAQGENAAANRTFEYAAGGDEMYLPLSIRIGRPVLASDTIVDRVWLQTWFTREWMQNRAAFHFRTAGNQATVELPPDAGAAELEVLLNGEPAELVSRAPGRIAIRLPQSNNENTAVTSSPIGAHTLELRYRQPYQHSLLTRHRLTPPQIEGSTALSQVYWQIVLPGDEHIVHSPQEVVTASRWQWLGTFWGREPLKSQPQLEEWAGATEQPPPPAANNQYLYTGLLPVASIELVSGPRWLVVSAASAGVLALVLGWIYVPAARRSWMVAAAAVALVVAAITYPAAALLLAQASVVGLILAVLAVALSRLVARPTRAAITPIISPSSQRMASPRSDSILMPPVIAAASTAPTVSLRMSDSER